MKDASVPDDNPCLVCTCNKGNVDCKKKDCAKPTCQYPYIPVGQCCPVCNNGCVVDGVNHEEGEEVLADDPCDICTCSQGDVDCMPRACDPLTCTNTYVPYGECCPVCRKGCTLNGVNYNEGDTVPDDNPCAKCKCMNGDVTCSYTNCTNPNCDNSYTPKGECCPKCVEGCEMNGVTYKEGQTVPDENPCANCVCRNGLVRCNYTTCEPLTCANKVKPAGKCCPECREGCVRNGKTYKEGETVPDDNLCASCTCQKGDVTCTYTTCTTLTCKDQYRPQGECCAKCREGCVMSGKTYKEGESVPDDNPCATCTCKGGEVECSYKTCVALPCANTYIPSGECCPACKEGCEKDGKKYKEGESIPGNNACENCKCTQGNVVCTYTSCQTLTCTNKVTTPGKCCPDCVQVCKMNGKDYKEGENVPSDNPCQTCTCRNGDVDCVYTVCVPPTCPNTYTPKGKCCLECVQGCTMNGKTYKDGDAVPTKDPCENCTCNNGDVDCDFTACAPPPCDVSYTPAAKCCPVCRTDCVRNEKTYKDGESVPDDNPCATCKCAKGVVKCGYKDCTPLTCAALYKPKGECCAKCKEGCEKNGQKYEHGR
ncbi:kielin/chordin-like protein [Dreissena polymorpha]|uniref:kielin/chordin-like protein n=1 Tax=Dreissena polymorpha TaxID=45954 RepID=UPI002263F272|nr:kielin/chordin-like protein [Dreissena polymorpha]